VSANTAALAIIHVRLKKAVFRLLHATFRTIHITNAAFDAFGIVPDRPLRPPTARMIFTGASRFKNYTAGGKLFP